MHVAEFQATLRHRTYHTEWRLIELRISSRTKARVGNRQSGASMISMFPPFHHSHVVSCLHVPASSPPASPAAPPITHPCTNSSPGPTVPRLRPNIGRRYISCRPKYTTWNGLCRNRCFRSFPQFFTFCALCLQSGSTVAQCAARSVDK